MDGKQHIEKALEGLKPVLASAGRSVEGVSFESPKATFGLSVFCGGCGCASSYKDGLEEMVKEVCPEITTIEFVEA